MGVVLKNVPTLELRAFLLQVGGASFENGRAVQNLSAVAPHPKGAGRGYRLKNKNQYKT